MVKVLVMYPRPPDTESFRKHYIERHLPLCRAIPGTERIRYAFEPQMVQGKEGWFCVYEAEYANHEALRRAQQTPEAKAAADDLRNYSPVSPAILICEVQEYH